MALTRTLALLMTTASMWLGVATVSACDKDAPPAPVVSPEAASEKALDCAGEAWQRCLERGHKVFKERPQRALELYREVCNGEPKKAETGGITSLDACVFASQILGRGAIGVRRDTAQAVALLERGCENEDLASCERLGRRLSEPGGELGAEDIPKAVKYLERACKLGREEVCKDAEAVKLIMIQGRPENWPELCERGNARSCIALAKAHHDGTDGRTLWLNKAEELFGKACDLEEAEGCAYLGVMMQADVAEDAPDKAAAAFTKGCELDDPTSCRKLGLMRYEGRKLKKAFEALDRACELDDVVGCTSVGQMYAAGQGTHRDVAKARAALAKGCKGGEQTACQQLASLPDK